MVMSDSEAKRFFGEQHELKNEMSIENCLKIFDEKQEQVKDY